MTHITSCHVAMGARCLGGMSGHSNSTRVVVLGGGYAGTTAANHLRLRPNVDVTLVNARSQFVERIRLHQLVADTHAATVDYDTLLGDGVRLVVGYATGIDTAAREVVLASDERLPYDYVVYAVGSTGAVPASHRQPGQVGDRDPEAAGDGDGQGADRGGLIDDHQHRAVFGQPGEHAAQCGLVVGQRLVMQPLPGRVDRIGVALGPAHVEPAGHGELGRVLGRVLIRIGQPPLPARRGRPTWSTRAGSHVTSRPHGSGLYQRSLARPSDAATTPPDHQRQGQSVIPGWRPASPCWA